MEESSLTSCEHSCPCRTPTKRPTPGAIKLRVLDVWLIINGLFIVFELIEFIE